MQHVRRAPEPIIWPLINLYRRFSRRMMLDARAMVIDGNGHIFLVKHSYIDGWYLPGGGVEPGESIVSALARELAEEGNIQLTGVPPLHGMFLNKHLLVGGHVALFVVREFRQNGPPQPNREIVAHGFFSPNALPHDTSRATRVRIDEVFRGQPVSELW